MPFQPSSARLKVSKGCPEGTSGGLAVSSFPGHPRPRGEESRVREGAIEIVLCSWISIEGNRA